MKYSKSIPLAFSFVCIRSDAFILPTKKIEVIGSCSSLNFAKKHEPQTTVTNKRIPQPGQKLADQNKNAPNISPERQIETVLAPVTGFLDNISDGWALSYADLTPYRYVIVALNYTIERLFSDNLD